MPGTLAPYIGAQWLTSAGAPAAGYKLFTYAAGTSTKQTTYSDYALSAANTNPIVLDSAGRAVVFVPAGIFKFVLALPTDTDPPGSPVWTEDGVASVPLSTLVVDVAGTAGEALTALNCVYLSDGSGGKTAGYWYKADGGNAYSSATAGRIGFVTATAAINTSCVVRVMGQLTGFSSLSAGVLYYASTAGAISSTPPGSPSVNKAIVAVADTSTSILVGPITPRSHLAILLPAATSVARGGSLINPNGIAAINVIAWYADFSCTVTYVKGYRVGGTGATVNARLNGTSNHLASDLSLTSANAWIDGGAVQNATYATGDKLEIMVTGVTGTVTQIGIQVGFSVP